MAKSHDDRTRVFVEHSLIALVSFHRVSIRAMPAWKRKFLLEHFMITGEPEQTPDHEPLTSRHSHVVEAHQAH